MKILYFHQYFTTPKIGGGIRSYKFARELIARGHEVTMVCGSSRSLGLPKTRSRGVSRGNIDGIDVIQFEIPYSNYMSFARRAWAFFCFALKCIRVALTEDYDLVFATSTPLTAGVPAVFAKIFRKKIFIFEVRDLWPELPRALGLKNPILLAGMSILEKTAYFFADACVGLAPGICDGIARRSREKMPIAMIPNFCDWIENVVPAKSRETRGNGGNGETRGNAEFIAIFPGAHGIANGLDAVLDAAGTLKNRGRNDIKFLFIGDGKMKPHLRSRAEAEQLENCVFFDPMPRAELRKNLANADVGLMVLKNIPAFYNGTSPNKFFDFVSVGLPILNNSPGWIAEQIREFDCGEIVPPNDANAFADALEKLADNPELCEKFRGNALRLARERFSCEKISAQFVDFVEKIARERQKNPQK